MTRLAGGALLCLLAAACGGEAADPPTPRTHVVEMRGVAYVPAEITVLADDTVVWRNADIVPHTVTGETGWGSGSIAVGGEWRMIATPGEFSYLCSFHPGMRGTLTVTTRG